MSERTNEGEAPRRSLFGLETQLARGRCPPLRWSEDCAPCSAACATSTPSARREPLWSVEWEELRIQESQDLPEDDPAKGEEF